MTLGTELQAAMKREKISTYRVSKETGIGPSYISKVIHDKANPSYRTLKRILDVLGYRVKLVKESKE